MNPLNLSYKSTKRKPTKGWKMGSSQRSKSNVNLRVSGDDGGIKFLMVPSWHLPVQT